MPPTLADRLEHILVAIDTIQRALANKRLEDLAADLMLRLAVERSFEIICEASRRIPDGVKAQQSELNWQRMADFGNQLRHAYHRIEPQILWAIAQRDLPPLREFVEEVIRNSGSKRPD
jgi:uncharacterized protein with HEPN domain